MKNITAGIIVGVLTGAGALSIALHHPALGAFLSDPDTAATATAVVTGIGSLVAGALKGWKQDSTTTATATTTTQAAQ
jgi:hypothetical protein